MYRPDRIGPYGWFDGDKSIAVDFAVANFDTVDLGDGSSTLFPWVTSVTVPESRNLESFFSDDVSLAAANVFSFGVPISGTFLKKGSLFSLDSIIVVVTDGPLAILPFIGQANSTPLTVVHNTTENQVSQGRYLTPTIQYSFGNVHMCGIRESINWLQVDDADPADENAILHGFAILNGSASASVITNIKATVCIEKYIRDTLIFDPVR